MCCPSCGERYYPRINPAVIVGVINGEKLLITRYRQGNGMSALIAGFTEIGETLEETVSREVMEEAGIRVTGLDRLTGLPEYRNGGLLVDTGVLVPKDPRILAEPLEVGDEAVVEWRALTVALLDRIAGLVRDRLGVTAEAFPLARVLQGGTWTAGRLIARQRRPDGGPPIRIRSDGTVF